MAAITLLQVAQRIKAIADVGLLYSANTYDTERYAELRELYVRMLSQISLHPPEAIRTTLTLPIDYPTAKVDIRGLVLRGSNILLVKEMADGKWSLPGGWAEVGFSPKEVVVKEFREETGLEVTPTRLLAVFDKKMHPHPAQPYTVYKMAFLCEIIGGEIRKGFDMLDVAYFPLNALPPLSEERILASQINLLAALARDEHAAPYVD